MQIISSKRCLLLVLLLGACHRPPTPPSGQDSAQSSPAIATPALDAPQSSPVSSPGATDPEADAFYHYIRGVSAELDAVMNGSEEESLSDLQRSIQEFESVVKLGYSPVSVRLNLARSLRFLAGRAADAQVRRELFGRASYHYKEAILEAEDSEDALEGFLAIEQQVFQRKDSELVEVLREVVEKDRTKVAVWTKIAELYTRLNRPEEARQVFLGLSKTQPDDAKVWLELGRSQLEAKRLEEAIQSFDRVIQLQPNEEDVFEAMRQKALSYYGLGRLEGARALLDELVRRQPSAPQNWLHLADFYVLAKDYSQAEAAVKRALSLDSKNFYANLMLGQILLASGRSNESLKVFERLTQLWPARPESWRILGDAQFSHGQYAQAITSLEESLRIDPQPAAARFSLAEAYRLSGRLGDAEAALTRLAREAPRNPAVLRSLYFVYLDRNEFTRAYALAIRLGQLEPGTYLSYYMLGTVLERMGRLDESIVALKQSIRLKPNFAGARNYLGYLYADHGIHLEDSVLEVRLALDLDPGNGSYLDSLGWALYKAGRFEESLKYLSQAVEVLERAGVQEPVVLEHLGDVHFELRCFSKASSIWEKALKLDASGERKTALEQKLRRVSQLPQQSDDCRSPQVSSPQRSSR